MNIMNTQYSIVVGPSSAPPPQQPPPPTWAARMAMRVARARWFLFLRRVFHYQNGSTRSSLGANPFDSGRWMAVEFAALTVQICLTVITLSVAREERPVWPMRIWVVGYDFGCFISLLILYWRYRFNRLRLGDDVDSQHPNNEDERCRGGMQAANKCKASLELFYAMWFVMGNVWLFDSRLQHSFELAPTLHVLCVVLLSINAVAYSFPFLLFLLLCVCVPLLSSALGFDINLRSASPAASDHQISLLPTWTFNHDQLETASPYHTPECCICLAKYKEKEEIRELPCSHIFHQKCVDHWLRIISCCPLCKQRLHC